MNQFELDKYAGPTSNHANHYLVIALCFQRLAGYDTSGGDTERMHRGHERTTSGGAGGGGGGGHVEDYSRMNSTLDRYGHERKQLVRNNRGKIIVVKSKQLKADDP